MACWRTHGPAARARRLVAQYGTINSIGLGEACKRAIEAGADVLLMPWDVPAAIDAVVTGVEEGGSLRRASIRPCGAFSP